MIETNHPAWKDAKLDFHKIYKRYLDEEKTISDWVNDNYETLDPIVNIAIEEYLNKILYPKIQNLEEMFHISRDLYSDLSGK